MPTIDPDRLLGDLRHLRTFGAHGNGVVRQSLTAIDLASREWLCDRLREAGLEPTIDRYGTVLGRSPHDGPALLVGSHTDTQPTGGWLDGALGVIYGLEVARALAEDPDTRALALDVASWIDEEGRFFGCLGSKAFCGRLPEAGVEDATALDGKRLEDALRAAGLGDREPHRFAPGRYAGYMEAHIEQGPYLEAEGKRIGVVTDIVGSRNMVVTFRGQQNHAGTTPMHLRRDATRGLFDFAHRVNAEFPARVGPRTVWTMGRVEIEPNAPSIVPGVARVNLQFRDPEESRLDALQDFAFSLVDEARAAGADARVTMPRDVALATAMDPAMQDHLAAAATTHAPGLWMRMPSGAVHDAQVLATCMPAAMLFIPSIGGISHAFEEDSRDEDIVLGCQVLADAAASFLAAAREG